MVLDRGSSDHEHVDPSPNYARGTMEQLERARRVLAGVAGSESTTSTEREKIMNEVNPGSGQGVVMAALVGAAVGAGVALLFAPCSGKETRGWLGHKGHEIKDRTTSAFEHVREATRRATKAVVRDGEQPHDRPQYAEAGAATMRI
jgi:hypothetical protein